MPLPDKNIPSPLSADIDLGLNNVSVANGIEQEGTIFDNTVTRYAYLRLVLTYSYATAPTANKTVEVRVKRQVTDTTFEDRSKVIGADSPPADAAAHSNVIAEFFPIVAAKYKFSIKNVDTGQTGIFTLKAQGHYEELAE
ncbi:MAG: hypothetical protein KatS3mg038_2816 [Candidatus Kapaibacterium sp.]|nr:MAG: hypothetical protein KatS3mg038_2816 [Candidatus Kapabacteria bacterium]